MYYLRILLRLTTLIFPIYIIVMLIAWGIKLTGGDISGFPYAFHPEFEFIKNASDHSSDTMITNFLLFGNIVVCFYLTKLFTVNIQYENSLVEFIGAPLAIFFLVSWFNPYLYEIVSIPGELISIYIWLCLVINMILLIMGYKIFGIPGFNFGLGLVSAYNKQVDKNVETRKNRTITNATQMGQNVLLDFSDGGQKFIFGYLQGYTGTTVTVKPIKNSKERITYNTEGHVINTRWVN